MIKNYLLLTLILVQLNSFGQADSVWNLMILKKGEQVEIKDNMAEYSPTGFYLHRNCFYDLKLNDKTKQTLRLVDIIPDTLVLIGISDKRDTNLSLKSTDTVYMDYRNIDKILLLKDWGTGASKKLDCDDYYFIFHQSLVDNRYESKYAYVFSSREKKNELVPRLSSYGITYHFEYGEKLYYHSGIEVKTPKYTDEEKVKALNAAMIALDFLVNKQVNISIQNTKSTRND